MARNCANPVCYGVTDSGRVYGHADVVHNLTTTTDKLDLRYEGACLVAGCACDAYAAPQPAPALA